ncbi:MAG: decarboxylase [Hungatella sp.]
MEKEQSLLEHLKKYSKSDQYPFHMPGHKRQIKEEFALDFPNPYEIDITEIFGFDNLHHPAGILKESMERSAAIYGADRTYYLINGSSCGILSAICGTTHNLGTILMSRNCHKSAYHGVFLNHLQTEYIYPQKMANYGVQGGLLPDEIERMLITHKKIQAVLIVSPTYDGIVSDIKTIATITHKYKIPLIVDEAHGAHFRYGRDFPSSALDLGADVVIQSLHKTLPSLTQTALLHVKEGYVDIEKIEMYLQIYQSSSPSYLLMAGMEHCIRWMETDGRQCMEQFLERLKAVRKSLGSMKHLKLLKEDVIGEAGIFDLDLSKLIISTRGTSLDGENLMRILRERYHLEMEMCGADYVTAIATVADTPEGLMRLQSALLEIDGELERDESLETEGELEKANATCGGNYPTLPKAKAVMTIFEAFETKKKRVLFAESAGEISAEYIYVYPPGIPIVVPGEILQSQIIKTVCAYQEMGLPVQGLKDAGLQWIHVIAI